ncbi:MAG: hypothetical protein ACRETQ_05810 [Gammaproteobacteria bacterium]
MNTPPDKKLDTLLEKLPREIQPRRDLWPGIAARIGRPQHWPRMAVNVLAVAAVLAAAAVVTWVIFSMYTHLPHQPAVASGAPNNANPATQAVNLLASFTLELAGNHEIPDKARAALLDNLNIVTANIARTEVAVKKYPDDVNLRGLLFNLYQQQAQLLSEAQQIQTQTMTRT